MSNSFQMNHILLFLNKEGGVGDFYEEEGCTNQWKEEKTTASYRIILHTKFPSEKTQCKKTHNQPTKNTTLQTTSTQVEIIRP